MERLNGIVEWWNGGIVEWATRAIFDFGRSWEVKGRS